MVFAVTLMLQWSGDINESNSTPDVSFTNKAIIFIGEKIEAKSHDDVTMLFSDIVGFTSICATATPMMVIAMLEDLYSVFDIFCEELDVYKVISYWEWGLSFRLPYVINSQNLILRWDTIGTNDSESAGSMTDFSKIQWFCFNLHQNRARDSYQCFF